MRRCITGASISGLLSSPIQTQAYPGFEDNDDPYDVHETNEKQEEEATIVKVDNNVVRFYGPVNRISCINLQYALNKLEDDLETDTIHLHVQSTGGELLSVFFVCDYIKQMKTPVYTYIDSYVASAASLITIVGKKRFISPHSVILIHQLSTQISGKLNAIKTEVTNLDTIMQLAKDVYLSNSKIDTTELNRLLQTDLWLNSTSALNVGFVDEIL
tara:strand:- start:2944 stop:3588 length:645 start_codon:yes stop_codon:yes gene_type:complete